MGEKQNICPSCEKLSNMHSYDVIMLKYFFTTMRIDGFFIDGYGNHPR